VQSTIPYFTVLHFYRCGAYCSHEALVNVVVDASPERAKLKRWRKHEGRNLSKCVTPKERPHKPVEMGG